MEYQSFVSEIAEHVKSLLDSTVSTSIHTALKNNGTELIGITFSHPGTNIFPTIYLEEFYQQYLFGKNINDIAKTIVDIYYDVKFESEWNVEQISNFNLAQKRIVYKLVHLDKNQKLLSKVPFLPFLDLAIVFYILLDKTERGAASILITNDIQASWKVGLTELYLSASQNSPKLLVPELKPMCAVVQEMLDTPCQSYEEHESRMYILTNQYRYLGASCILYHDVLEDIGNQLNEDFYVLPSSIHETIILPCRFSPGKEILDSMITEINETQVSEEEILSDHAYYYSRTKRTLLMVEQ